MKKSTTENFGQTQKIGQDFAREILASKPSKNAVVLGLQGDLGAGKTTFLQGFARGLGIKESVLSPTFIVMKRFKIPNNVKSNNRRPSIIRFENFYHFDCYRLNEPEEILLLGFGEIISNPKNIVAVEWPEKIKKAMPQNAIFIKFKHLEENTREVILPRPMLIEN